MGFLYSQSDIVQELNNQVKSQLPLKITVSSDPKNPYQSLSCTPSFHMKDFCQTHGSWNRSCYNLPQVHQLFQLGPIFVASSMELPKLVARSTSRGWPLWMAPESSKILEGFSLSRMGFYNIPALGLGWVHSRS